MSTTVTWLVALLFITVSGLLVYGFFKFHRESDAQPDRAGRQVSMRLEVVWTAVSALLLFAVFLYAR
jgi:heme/copper-type cytochrome/quinol oxidase subunit 2